MSEVVNSQIINEARAIAVGGKEGVSKPESQLEVLPGTTKELGHYFLGQRGFEFHDDAEIEVPDSNLDVEVYQNSAGLTGVRVKGREGHTVKVLRENQQGGVEWVSSNDPDRYTVVASNYGNMGPGLRNPDSSNVGNAGIRAGLVQVTSQEANEAHYFVVGANFSGMADNWNVRASMAEVKFRQQQAQS